MKLIKSSYLIYAILASAFIGFLDSAYLTILHYQHVIPPCTVTNGCETVLTSSYSQIFGIPIALLGAGFYISIIVLSLLLLTSPSKLYKNLLVVNTVVGFVISLILLYIQFGIIGTYCQYCLLSEAINFSILGTVFLLWRKKE